MAVEAERIARVDEEAAAEAEAGGEEVAKGVEVFEEGVGGGVGVWG